MHITGTSALHRALNRRKEQFFRIGGRVEAICPASEITPGEIERRYVPNLSKPSFARERQHFRWCKEADERRPAGPCSLLRHLKPGTNLGVREFERHQERHGEC